MSLCGPHGNSGGGGGTYVIVEDEDEPLIVAGGGGGTRSASPILCLPFQTIAGYTILPAVL